MKIGIMQPYFFPYIGYFQLINAVDTFMLYEHVSFRMYSYITKNTILDKGRRVGLVINVPVQGKSPQKMIGEIKISEENYSRKKLLDKIRMNYKRAAFFEQVYPVLEKAINQNTSFLHVYNALIIKDICDFLEIKTPIIYKNESFLALEEKLPSLVSTKEEEKSKRIFEICKAMGATTYVNPIGGTELYDKEYFKENNIHLDFIKTDSISYPQFKGEHVPYLSIIDVLMHNGKEGTQELLTKCQLV